MEELGKDNENDLIELRRILLDYTPDQGASGCDRGTEGNSKSKPSGVNVAREQYMRYSGLRILPQRWTIVSELANNTVKSCGRKSCPESVGSSLQKRPSSSVRTRSQLKAGPDASPPVLELEPATSTYNVSVDRKRKARKKERQQKTSKGLVNTRCSARRGCMPKSNTITNRSPESRGALTVEAKPALGRPYRSIKWKLCNCCIPGRPLRFHDRAQTLRAPSLAKAVKKPEEIQIDLNDNELATNLKVEPDTNDDTGLQSSPENELSATGDAVRVRSDSESPYFDREIRILLERIRVPGQGCSAPIVKVEPENTVETEGNQAPVAAQRPATAGDQETPFQCPRCGVVKRTFLALAHHLKKHEQAKRELPVDTHKFSCDKCGMKFFSEIAFNHHYLNWHKRREERKKRQHLLMLSRQNVRTDSVLAPTRGYNPLLGRFACMICKEKFPTGLLLDQHFSSAHRAVLEYKCQFCCKRFHNEIALEDHKNAIHNQ